MSRRAAARAARRQSAARAARRATLVAVLERHGRFLTAEPLFPPRERAGRVCAGAAPAPCVGDPRRRGGRALSGELVLVHRAGALGSGRAWCACSVARTSPAT